MSKEITYNKLVRDDIPQIIKNDGKDCVTHKVSGSELEIYLLDKVVEELEEFKENPCEEELADILEVIDGIIDHYKFNRNNIREIQKNKRDKRGGFKKGIILDKVIKK